MGHINFGQLHLSFQTWLSALKTSMESVSSNLSVTNSKVENNTSRIVVNENQISTNRTDIIDVKDLLSMANNKNITQDTQLQQHTTDIEARYTKAEVNQLLSNKVEKMNTTIKVPNHNGSTGDIYVTTRLKGLCTLYTYNLAIPDNANSLTTIAIIPENYRPIAQMVGIVQIANDGTTASVILETNGSVQIYGELIKGKTIRINQTYLAV